MKEELTMRGEYNPSEWYHRMDVVTNGKRAFLVLLSNKGHDLNDTKYFMAIASAEGINGKDGMSAYDLAVKFEGFQGSVTDWLDSLKGGGSGDGSGVSLKIDKSQIATIKKPSDYSEGFSYELKQLRLLVPNNGLSSQYALLSTKSVREGSNIYSFQTAVALDADHSYTWYRVGNSATNKWSTWDLDTVFGDATGENGGGSGTGTPTIPILTAIGWDKITGKPDLVTQNELDIAKAELQNKIDAIPKSSGESGASIKIDKTNTEMVKAPSQYTDGLSYEVKLLKKLLPDTNVKGTYVLLSTKALQQNGKVYCVQTAKTLDSDHQYTWYRSGNSGDDKWTNWDLNTVFPDDSTSSGDDLSKKISWSDITGVPDFITAAALKKDLAQLEGDTSDGNAALYNLTTDKAIYKPTEKVTFSTNVMADHGTIVATYYSLGKKISSQTIKITGCDAKWSWLLPDNDKTGYIAEIKVTVGKNTKTYYLGISVSNSNFDFPIMGFVSEFGEDNPLKRKEVVNYLNRLHINLVQFYDWADLHSVPLPTMSGSDSPDATFVPNTWSDIGNRLIRRNVIEDYCQEVKNKGMMAMCYMAMNGSDTNQEVHGLKSDMFLYDDASGSASSISKQLDKDKGWGKYSIYLTNWMKEDWQQYMHGVMLVVMCNLPFDGWHIDMFGDAGDKYDNTGSSMPSSFMATGIHYFLDAQKSLGCPLGINSVGEYGLPDIEQSTDVSYLYSEVWDNRTTYDALSKLIIGMREATDKNGNKKGVIIPAYMDYQYAKDNESGKQFNTPGVIYTDLVIMASGGTHLEMGEHMLDNEYFPNSNLSMSDDLKNNWLPKIYDFAVAYKQIIGAGYKCDGLATIADGLVDELAPGQVCGISRRIDDDVLGLSLINFKGALHEYWKDTSATQTAPTKTDVTVTIKLGATNHDWYYADLDNPVPQPLKLDANGSVTIHNLDYFGFIFGTPKGA